MTQRRLDNRSPFQRHQANLRVVRGAEDSDDAEILIYDEIGFWGIRAQEFIRELNAINANTIHVRINSPGGSVFEGLSIANALKAHKATIACHVDALAASIASVIALAGDEVLIAENAFLMIHNAFTIAIGNAEELRKDAGVLDKIDTSIIAAYVAKTGADDDQVKAWMKAETWFNADEAKEHGFVDAIENGVDAKAEFDLSVFNNAPAALARREAAPTPKDLERALRDAGLSRAAAKAVLAEGYRPATPPLRDAGELEAALLDGGRQLLATLTA
jgi:ATP-dependent Clp protease, protease subunit